MLPRIPRRGFNPKIRGDSTQHNRLDLAPTQLKIQLRPVKRAPLPLRNDNIRLQRTYLRSKLRPLRRHSASRRRRRSINLLLQPIGRVTRKRNVHQNHHSPASLSFRPSATPFSTICAALYGASGTPNMPFCRSISTSAQERGSNVSDISISDSPSAPPQTRRPHSTEQSSEPSTPPTPAPCQTDRASHSL
jgi:hypothetical protein